MAETATKTAPQEIGGGYQQFQDRLERQRQQYATRWLYSPMIRVSVQSFPGLNILGGRVTPLTGENLAKHYGLKDLDKDLVEALGGLIQLTESGRNYYHYVPPAEVASNVVMENMVVGVIELEELRGVPASEAAKINRALFGDDFEPAPARLQRLKKLAADDLDDSITMTANRCIVSTRSVYREALNVVNRAKARLATPGNMTGLDEYEMLCFDFTGEPLSESTRQGRLPEPAAADSTILAVLEQNKAVLEQNATMLQQLTAIQLENARTNARQIEIFAKLAGDEPSKTEVPTPTSPASAKDETTAPTPAVPKRRN